MKLSKINQPPAPKKKKIITIDSSNIKTILLSRFDYCWLTLPLGVWNGSDPISQETESFLRKYTLVDELPRKEKIGNRVEIKLNYFSDSKIIVLTSCFNLFNPFYNPKGKNSPENEPLICSFCVVFDEKVFPKVIENYSVITSHVDRMSKFYKSLHKLQVTLILFDNLYYKENENENLEKFNVSIVQFVKVFNTLCTCGLEEFGIPDTMFSKEADFSRYNSRFLATAISSHLRTHGYTVIVGKNEDEIRTWVNTISLFLLPNERKRCRHAKEGVNFVPELFVQGVFIEDGQNIKDVVPIRDILFGSYPVTIIDLHNRTPKVYAFKKYNFFKLFLYEAETDVKSSLKSRHIEENKKVYPAVEKVLRSISFYPEFCKEGYISEWIRLLNRKALAFIKFDDIFGFTDCNRADKLIILAASEKIQPGIYIKVHGNLTEEVETIIDFLENM